MVVQRCAWHTTYRGYPLYYRFARDGRLAVTRTNGICPDCAARVRTEWRMVRHGTRPPVRTPPVLRLSLATLALATTVLIAHAIDPASTVAVPPALTPDVQLLTATTSSATPFASFVSLQPSPRTPSTPRHDHPNTRDTLTARAPVHLTSAPEPITPPSPRTHSYDCSAQLP